MTRRARALLMALVWMFRFTAFALPLHVYVQKGHVGDLIFGWLILGPALLVSTQWLARQARQSHT